MKEICIQVIELEKLRSLKLEGTTQAAVFCINRDAYNHNLAVADKGTQQSIETWCEYVPGGLDNEGSNRYRLSIINSFLSRGMIQALETEGYIPVKD